MKRYRVESAASDGGWFCEINASSMSVAIRKGVTQLINVKRDHTRKPVKSITISCVELWALKTEYYCCVGNTERTDLGTFPDQQSAEIACVHIAGYWIRKRNVRKD